MSYTPEQIEAECIALAATPPTHRGISQGRYTWGKWYDAAVRAVGGGDFSEYAWMLEQDAEYSAEYDDDGYSDYLYDQRRDEQLVRAYERELCA
jgi:hypothetical protein